MKSKNFNKEIAQKTGADLVKLAADKKEALRAFRFGSAGAKAKNVKEGKALRKDIARVMTAINLKENGKKQ